jgi:hypothetical protein
MSQSELIVVLGLDPRTQQRSRPQDQTGPSYQVRGQQFSLNSGPNAMGIPWREGTVRYRPAPTSMIEPLT